MFKFIEAKTIADIVDPDTTLGIEITDRDVATRCGLGNLDGQHVARDDWMAGLAAIEIAMRVDLDACLAGHPGPPRPGSNLPTIVRGVTTLATTRPDVDSVGAMAVLVLRSLGIAIDVEFVNTVAKADSFRAGTWSPKPLPTVENPWPSGTTTVDSTQPLAAFGVICSPRPSNLTRSLSLAQRVFLMAIRIATDSGLIELGARLGGDIGDGEHALADACSVERQIRGQWPRHFIRDMQDEAQLVRVCLARAAHEPGALATRDGFVEVRVAHSGALSLGYCLAPVVVAFDQTTTKWFVEEFRGELGWKAPFGVSPASDEKYRKPCDSYSAAERLSYEFSDELQSIGSPAPTTRIVSRSSKVTIAAYTDGHLDTAGLTAELNRLEEAAGGAPKWGGPRNMVCSPSHVGTRLAEETISAAVSRFVVRQ